MIAANIPHNEAERLRALHEYGILDSEMEESYDALTRLAKQICGVPASMISLVDTDRQWFKSRTGIDASETDRDISFCAHTILDDAVMEVPDAMKDERFHDNPLVHGETNVRFYAGAPLITSDGYRIGAFCVIDHSAHKLTPEQSEALRILANQTMQLMELRRTMRKLGKTSSELAELNEQKDRFLSILAHDLRTPLGNIVSLAELLADDCGNELPEDDRQLLHDIRNGASTTLNTFDNLLKWIMIETKRLPREGTPDVDLVEPIRSAMAIVDLLAERKRLSMELDAGNGIQVQANRQMLQSLFQNLLSNAIKFTPENGRVTIKVREEEDHIRCEVSDTGIGMTAEKTARLFKIGERVSTAGTNGEQGGGLGLILCAQYLRKIGGDIFVHSEPGKGTRFTILLTKQSS